MPQKVVRLSERGRGTGKVKGRFSEGEMVCKARASDEMVSPCH